MLAIWPILKLWLIFNKSVINLLASPIIVPTDGIIDSVSTKTLVSSLPLKERLIEVGRHYLHKYEERECKNHIFPGIRCCGW